MGQLLAPTIVNDCGVFSGLGVGMYLAREASVGSGLDLTGQGVQASMKYDSSLAVGLLMALVVAAGDPVGGKTIEGSVLDNEWSVRIATAGVALLSVDDSILAEYITDDRGRLVIPVPDDGEYRLRATPIGYMPATSQAFVLQPGQDVLAFSPARSC